MRDSPIRDMAFVAQRWRVVHLLGVATLRSRYARSKMGQMWLTVSTLVMVVSTGLVWSLIWKMSIEDFLPYFAVGQIIFIFLSQTLNESSGIFVADARLYLNERVPFLTSVAAHVYRNFLILLHNIPIILLVIWWSDSTHPALSWMYVPAVLGTVLFLVTSNYITAALCTRFRDMVQIIGLLMQIAFLLTPVMWKTEFLPAMYQTYVLINPFSAMLETLRNPLLGLPVNSLAYLSLLGWDVALLGLFMLVYRRFDRATIFWV